MRKANKVILWISYFLFLVVLDRLPLDLGTPGGWIKVFFFFFPLFLLVQLLYGYFYIKYSQEFDRDHLSKGDVLKYSLTFENEGLLPSPFIKVAFQRIMPVSRQKLPDLYFILKKGERREYHWTIQCPYRGVYTLGLSRLVIEDSIGFFSFSMPIWQKTFYVYPRRLPFPLSDLDILGRGQGVVSRNKLGVENLDIFSHIRPYKPGESLRYFDWRRWMGKGQAVLKEFEREQSTGAILLFDAFREEEDAREEDWSREDGQLEVALSLAGYLIERGIPTTFYTLLPHPWKYEFNKEDDLTTFLKRTLEIRFGPWGSMAFLYKSEIKKNLSRGNVVFISNRQDEEVLELISSLSGGNWIPHFFYCDNRETIDPGLMEYFHMLNQEGKRCHLIRTGPSGFQMEA